jgi:hypothetical protein
VEVDVESLAVGFERRYDEGFEVTDRDSGDPALALVPPDDHRRHKENTRRGRAVGERETPEGEQPGSRPRQGIGDGRGSGDPLPGDRGVTHAIGAAELEPKRFTVPDETETASHPEQRMPRLEQRHERAEIRRRGGLDSEGRHRGTVVEGRGCGHPANTSRGML